MKVATTEIGKKGSGGDMRIGKQVGLEKADAVSDGAEKGRRRI